MSTLPYLDIHTHRRLPLEDSVTVSSLSVEELLGGEVQGGHLTAGVHPWWLEEYTAEEIEGLRKRVQENLERGLLWGVGETGLDRSMPELMEKQLDLFHWHIDRSEEFQLPLVIHNVRAGSDLLGILKARRPKMPWIFHDFRGNEDLMGDLLRLHPDCYFSFGLSLDNSPQVRELLPKVPLQNLFLETDNQKHLDIHDIYVRAHGILGIPTDLLKSQIWQNFKKITPSKH